MLFSSVLAKPVEALSVLVSVANLGPKVKGSGDTQYNQPVHLLAALDWRLSLGENHSVELMADPAYYFVSKNYSVSAGAEYAFKQALFARVGYHYASEYAPIPSHLAFGLGFHFKGFRLDAQYITASDYIAGTVGVGFSSSL